MGLQPIQELVGSEVQCFKCGCGIDKFKMGQGYLEGGEPQLGVVERDFECICGVKYKWEYGIVRVRE